MYVDDLALLQHPAIGRICELSLHQGQTSFAWDTWREFPVGGVASTSVWDPASTVVTSSDHSVLPPGNIELDRNDAASDHLWAISTRAGAETGRSTVDLTVTDPATGLTAERTFPVTVNAGNNFDNGDFERGAAGWTRGWFDDSWEVVQRQRWRYLGPSDQDQVLRISSGGTGFLVTGLTPGVSYTARAEAFGDGARLEALANTPAGCVDADPATSCVGQWGAFLGSSPIDRHSWGSVPEFQLTPQADDPATPGNETDTWIYVTDTTPSPDGESIPASARPCVVFAAGESCVDEIGVFRTSDLAS